ncbi:MAG: secernin-3 [Chloroflexi bacterium]|nr:secernin-3 [Chloroflexota bacterium]
MPFSCDTMVALPNATKGGQTLFAKNSDRPQEESQPLVQRDREAHPGGTFVRCQFLEIPQAAVTYRHVGSRPYWCWGYEHGFNEHQVAIGNEALASKIPVFEEPKLLGMDLVRLGLERGRTAAEAVEVITDLITTYGQGRFQGGADVGTYDNGFLVADPHEAYVIETAGHEWAVKRVESTLGISNIHSIGTDWERLSPSAERHAIEQGWWQLEQGRLHFAEAYCDFSSRQFGGGPQRRARSCAVLKKHRGEIDVRTMMALLRDHSNGEDPEEPFREEPPNGISICWHYTEEVGVNTAASLVADLCADGSRLPVYWCSFYSPCLGVFLPVFIQGQIPAALTIGDAEPSDKSLWWLFRKLERAVRQDPSGEAAAAVRAVWRGFQDKLLETAYQIAAEARQMIDAGRDEEAAQKLTDYMHRNVQQAQSTLQDMLTRGPLTVANSRTGRST